MNKKYLICVFFNFAQQCCIVFSISYMLLLSMVLVLLNFSFSPFNARVKKCTDIYTLILYPTILLNSLSSRSFIHSIRFSTHSCVICKKKALSLPPFHSRCLLFLFLAWLHWLEPPVHFGRNSENRWPVLFLILGKRHLVFHY